MGRGLYCTFGHSSGSLLCRFGDPVGRTGTMICAWLVYSGR